MKYNKKQINNQIVNLEIGSTLNITDITKNEIGGIRAKVTHIKKKFGQLYRVNKNDNGVDITRIENEDNLGLDLSNMRTGEVVHYDLRKYDTLRTYSAKFGLKVRTVVEVTKV